jgi:hypothetical protein
MTGEVGRIGSRGLALAAFLITTCIAPHGNARVVVRTAVNYRPVARAVVGTAVVATAAVATAAVVGSVVNSIPPSCGSVMVGNVAYQQCGSTWYQPQYAGSSVTYIVVNPPQ